MLEINFSNATTDSVSSAKRTPKKPDSPLNIKRPKLTSQVKRKDQKSMNPQHVEATDDVAQSAEKNLSTDSVPAYSESVNSNWTKTTESELESDLQKIGFKLEANVNSNLFNITKPIFLGSLLQEVTAGATYQCIYV